MLEFLDPQVVTAADFLGEVFQKGHQEAELRNYLINRRHLTDEQVDQAFKILNNRVDVQNRKKADRPEVEKQKTTSSPKWAFLLPANREMAKNFTKEFLLTEYNYLNVLDCLVDEYYNYLCETADRGKIIITRKELEQIFRHVIQLSKFHRKFYEDVRRRKVSFGHLFVQNFHSFRGYLEYIKGCNFATMKMRDYNYDKKLRKSLEHVRLTSRRPNDEMMDLILSPLDRINDYKNFLQTLYGWADKRQETDYVYLGKACRRIGRVADYIDKWKHIIINRNEMNKVQQFLDKQCNIISANRRIVRRGLMIRRTTTWPARNKHYIFFLFNDVLLWTSKKGELQNIVFLRDCEVGPSDSKVNASKKFEVIARGRHCNYNKLLKLECKDVHTRNEWYNVLVKEIASAREDSTSKEENNSSKNKAEEDLVNYIKSIAESQPSPGSMTPPAESEHTVEHKKNDSIDGVFEEEEEEINPAHRRYEMSENFRSLDFGGTFLPMDDMSVTSETEQDPTLDAQNLYGESMDALFPNTDARQGDLDNTSNGSRSKIKRQEDLRYDKISRISSRKMTRMAERDSKNTKRTNIIRTDLKPSSDFKNHSSFTISLCNFNK